MRKWVDKFLSEMADKNEKIRLIIADVGDFPLFFKKHSNKFFNVGVSESNAIGIAAGLASEGYIVYVYGVSSFFLYRAYEQFKYSISYWKQRVTFIGVGFGWKYFNIGIGHFCPDDILLVQSFPYFEIYTPYNLLQLSEMLKYHCSGPKYIRLTANILEEPIDKEFTCSKEYMLVTYGEMVKSCINVIRKLHNIGLTNVGLIPLQSLNEKEIKSVLCEYENSNLFIVEDQCANGGLYPLLREMNVNIRIHINLPLLPDKIAESRHKLLESYRLDENSIFQSWR